MNEASSITKLKVSSVRIAGLKFNNSHEKLKIIEIERTAIETPPRASSFVTFTGSVFVVVKRKTVTMKDPIAK